MEEGSSSPALASIGVTMLQMGVVLLTSFCETDTQGWRQGSSVDSGTGLDILCVLES